MSENACGKASSSNTDSDKRVCPDCGKEYSNRSGLRYHLNLDKVDCVGVECPTCDKNLISEKGMKQHHAESHGESLWGELVECGNCGDEYRERIYRVENCTVTYCSKECQKEHYNTDEIPITPLSGSDSPNWKGGWMVEVSCDNCGECFEKRSDQIERYEKTYCSKDCLWEGLSQRYRREGSHLWKGGYEYYGHNWTEVAKEARENDNYTCQSCGTHQDNLPSALDVHHITPLREFEDYEEANKLDNLVSLCTGCHRIWEGIPLRPTLIDS